MYLKGVLWNDKFHANNDMNITCPMVYAKKIEYE